ncbi:MAG: glycoside hydrolase [Sphaerochaetaceae bacterium]|nr:glycoside hydrolase [Sphaerochaetaceae bacterium]
MKYVIKNIKSYEMKGNSICFAADGGCMELRFMGDSMLRVLYSFDDVPVAEDLQEASDFICECGNSIPCGRFQVSETEYGYQIAFGKLDIRVRSIDAVISVYKDGKLVHGGLMGNEDTVIPSYTIRCITDGHSPNGYWNFPLKDGDEFYGLGDKSGVPDRIGRSFRFFNRDSLGYNASYSDPLYKSVPFVVKYNRISGVCCGLLFPQTMIDHFDFGRESMYFYSVQVCGGPFCYYLFTGDDYTDVMKSYYEVSGKSIFPPLFSFGFMGSSMNYVEPDDAAKRVMDYFERVEKEGIPCEGLYMSSGYLKHGGKRYTFLINKEKFPDPKAYFTALHDRGYNMNMNIKPGVLVSHPWYAELDQKGYFLKDQNGKTVTEFYWGGNASFIDFDNPEAAAWWKGQLKDKFLENGCTGIWNDNNELELEDISLPAYRVKQIYPVKMAKVAYEAFKEACPDNRPWNYSRSGYAGIQRYARTWSGDNTSTWTALKYNQYMGIGFGLSGMPFFGHDIGGFAGEVPEEELLVRASETAVFQSRFVIHSWRESGEPTEPWTYPDSTDVIESLIKEHYRYLPYIYSCAYQHIRTGKPVERSLHLEFPKDARLCSDNLDCLFGDSVLKVNVCDKGIRTKEVLFPSGCDWVDPYCGCVHKGGTAADVDVSVTGKPHWFARCGSVIATSETPKMKNTQDLYHQVALLVYPMPDGGKSHESLFYVDDGKTELDLGKYSEIKFNTTDKAIEIKKESVGYDNFGTLTMVLPEGFVFDENGRDRLTFSNLDSIPAKVWFKGNYGEKCSNNT